MDESIIPGNDGSDDGGGDWTVISPTNLGSGGSDPGDGEPKRRGRKPGSRNTSQKSEVSGAVGSFDLREILVSFHAMLAIRLKRPAIEITKEQAAKIQQAIKLVEKHHRISMSQKHMDYAMALWIIAEIYGPMAVTIYLESKLPAASPEASQPDPTILPFMQPVRPGG